MQPLSILFLWSIQAFLWILAFNCHIPGPCLLLFTRRISLDMKHKEDIDCGDINHTIISDLLVLIMAVDYYYRGRKQQIILKSDLNVSEMIEIEYVK